MNSKAQAGLEYLMTYGWALILIATVIGVLVFIVSSPTQNVTFSSSEPNKIMLKGGTASETAAEVKVQNITGGQITITNITTTGSLEGSTITLNNVEFDTDADILAPIQAGEEMFFELDYTASAGAGSITLTYTDYAGLTRTATINASGGSGTTTPPAATCGNSALDAGETCDGTLLGGETCVTQGYLSGTLACNANCLSYNTSACVSATCGNGIIEGSEECDGAALGGATCVSEGYANCTGTLPGCSNCTLTQGTCKTDLLCGAGSFSSSTGWTLTGDTYIGGGVLDITIQGTASYNFGTYPAGTYRGCIDFITCQGAIEADMGLSNMEYSVCGEAFCGDTCCDFIIPPGQTTSLLTFIAGNGSSESDYLIVDSITVIKQA